MCLATGTQGETYRHLQEGYAGTYDANGYDVIGDYRVIDWVDNQRYDKLLSRNLVFLDLYAASASNVVIECMRRNTPLLVNPLPAVRDGCPNQPGK